MQGNSLSVQDILVTSEGAIWSAAKHTATNRAVSRRTRIGVPRVTRDLGPAQVCPHNSCVATPRAGLAAT
jgi:hypothetical protein